MKISVGNRRSIEGVGMSSPGVAEKMGRHQRKKRGNGGEANSSIENNKKVDNDTQMYSIEESDVMGRYFVAKSDLAEGTILLEEDPLVIGPSQGSSPICIACYVPINISKCERCKSCGWPLCQSSCKGVGKYFGHTQAECDILQESKVQPTSEDYCLYNVLTPLRILLLKTQNENNWQIIKSMEAHSVHRKKTEMWKDDDLIIDFVKKSRKLLKITEDEVHSICGYIQVNGFGVDSTCITALFPSAFLLSHDCTPNTTHVVNKNFHFTLRNTVYIKKGDPITISYCNTLHGTWWRREQLEGSKFFACTCRRCRDKTEFNTWMSAIKCIKCTTGYLLPTDPLDNSSHWKCDRCDNSKPIRDIHNFISRLLDETDKLTDKSIDEIEKFLKKHEDLLHPHHFICLIVKIKLSQLYGKTHDCMIQNMSTNQLKTKIDMCKEIIKIFDVIEPGLSRIRGITLYELHAPVLILGTEDFKKSNNPKKFKQTLREVKKYLHEANKILNIEDPTSTEGLIGKAAEFALEQMNN